MFAIHSNIHNNYFSLDVQTIKSAATRIEIYQTEQSILLVSIFFWSHVTTYHRW